MHNYGPGRSEWQLASCLQGFKKARFNATKPVLWSKIQNTTQKAGKNSGNKKQN